MSTAVEKPRIGDRVHYVSYGTPGGEYESVCRAAIVTQAVDDHVKMWRPDGGDLIEEPCIDLCVLNPEGLFFNQGVTHDESPSGGTWHWAADSCD